MYNAPNDIESMIILLNFFSTSVDNLSKKHYFNKLLLLLLLLLLDTIFLYLQKKTPHTESSTVLNRTVKILKNIFLKNPVQQKEHNKKLNNSLANTVKL